LVVMRIALLTGGAVDADAHASCPEILIPHSSDGEWGMGNGESCRLFLLPPAGEGPQADEGLLILLFQIPNPECPIPAPSCSFSRLREKVPQADEGLLIRLFRIPNPEYPIPAP